MSPIKHLMLFVLAVIALEGTMAVAFAAPCDQAAPPNKVTCAKLNVQFPKTTTRRARVSYSSEKTKSRTLEFPLRTNKAVGEDAQRCGDWALPIDSPGRYTFRVEPTGDTVEFVGHFNVEADSCGNLVEPSGADLSARLQPRPAG